MRHRIQILGGLGILGSKVLKRSLEGSLGDLCTEVPKVVFGPPRGALLPGIVVEMATTIYLLGVRQALLTSSFDSLLAVADAHSLYPHIQQFI